MKKSIFRSTLFLNASGDNQFCQDPNFQIFNTIRRGGLGHLFKHIAEDNNYKIVPTFLSFPFSDSH